MDERSAMADALALKPGWSRLADFRQPPEVNMTALRQYRLRRIRQEMIANDIPLCLLSNPLSLRYAADIRQFSVFQARVPILYLAVPVEGPIILFGGLVAFEQDSSGVIDAIREGRGVTVLESAHNLGAQIDLFCQDICGLVQEIGITDRRIAIENMSPLVPKALIEEGFDVSDAQVLMENARRIKSAEEVACMRWSIAVAEHAMEKMKEALRPGIRENQLWALLNYVNVANDGEWHDSQQLTAGPRTNPFPREASDRAIRDGELVAFDTDMIGPFGYCADISRTFHCGPRRPTDEQRDLYRRAHDQLCHNLAIIKPGVSFRDVKAKAYVHPEGYRRIDLLLHGIGMSDELPFLLSSQPEDHLPADDAIEPGMALCIEAYAGRIDGPQGVKLEEQVLVTADGIEVLTQYPFEQDLLN